MYYNIHNKVKIRIVTTSPPSPFGGVNDFFSFFKVEGLQDPDIELRIGKFTPIAGDTYQVDHRYRIADNYLHAREHSKRSRWECEIVGFEQGKTCASFSAHSWDPRYFLMPDYLAQNAVLRPLVEMKLLHEGFVVVHGLGLEKNGKALIFPARGGAHKSRIAADAIRTGSSRLLGDDRVIVGPGKRVMSFPLFLELALFRSRHPSDDSTFSLRDRIRLAGHMVAHRQSTPVHSVAQDGALEGVFFLVRRKNIDHPRMVSLDLDTAVNRVVRGNQMEMLRSGMAGERIHFLNYVQAYSFVFPNSEVAGYWDRMRQLIESQLNGLPIYEILLPMRYTDEVSETIRRLF